MNNKIISKTSLTTLLYSHYQFLIVFKFFFLLFIFKKNINALDGPKKMTIGIYQKLKAYNFYITKKNENGITVTTRT